jgi:hypothetical protein
MTEVNQQNNLSPPEIEVKIEKLINAGFTATGVQRYQQTIDAYSQKLFSKSILYGDTEKVDGFHREVTQEHVRKGASSLSSSINKSKKPTWVIPCQMGEYIGVATAGAGASNLDSNYGILAFGLGLFISVVLFSLRITNENKNGE